MTRPTYIRPTRITLHVSALRKNISLIQTVLGSKAEIFAVIKANAYGHGDLEMATALKELGIKTLAVADLKEAEKLRAHGVEMNILCLGAMPEEALPHAIESRITITAHSMAHIKVIGDYLKNAKQSAQVHLKFDTGMHRLGIDFTEANSALDLTEGYKGFNVVGIFSHFAEAENPDQEFTNLQLQRFSHIRKITLDRLKRPIQFHIANSAGILAHPSSHLDAVRPGIALYGYPQEVFSSRYPGFAPILSWRAPILQIKKIDQGDTVGYNRRFKAMKPMTIAVVGVGYGDGYRRSFASVGVGYQGKRVAVLGIICMDLMMIDVTGSKNPRVGDDVLLLDPTGKVGPSAWELAQADHTIPYEILTGISQRVSRSIES